MKAADDAQAHPPVIILAGGRSSRFGSPKGLAVLSGQSLLSAHLAACKTLRAAAVVVTGQYHDEYAAEVVRVSSGNRLSATCVQNPDPDRGPFSSLQIGLRACAHFGKGAFVQPVDSGPVGGALFLALYEQSRHGSISVVPTVNGKGGHPVYLSPLTASLCEALDPSAPGARLDMVLRQLPCDALLRVEVGDPRILRNMNSPNDLL